MLLRECRSAVSLETSLSNPRDGKILFNFSMVGRESVGEGGRGRGALHVVVW